MCCVRYRRLNRLWTRHRCFPRSGRHRPINCRALHVSYSRKTPSRSRQTLQIDRLIKKKAIRLIFLYFFEQRARRVLFTLPIRPRIKQIPIRSTYISDIKWEKRTVEGHDNSKNTRLSLHRRRFIAHGIGETTFMNSFWNRCYWKQRLSRESENLELPTSESIRIHSQISQQACWTNQRRCSISVVYKLIASNCRDERRTF